jgi:hypothetical protein
MSKRLDSLDRMAIDIQERLNLLISDRCVFPIQLAKEHMTVVELGKITIVSFTAHIQHQIMFHGVAIVGSGISVYIDDVSNKALKQWSGIEMSMSPSGQPTTSQQKKY